VLCSQSILIFYVKPKPECDPEEKRYSKIVGLKIKTSETVYFKTIADMENFLS
jgi:hypothetical protein